MRDLINYIRYYVKLSPLAEKAILERFNVREYQKDDLLLREGDTCRNLYFLMEGTLRTFYHDDGKEVTTWIYPDGFFVTAWSSFLLGQPSFESIQALQPTKVAFITKSSLYNLYDLHPSMERFGRYLAEEQLSSIDEYAKGYHLLTAKEKYDNLLEFFPDVEQRSNLGYIASMLGISQETLSRIRKA